MSSNATDEAFWRQIEGDAKRTVLCEPHRLDEIRVAVEQRGFTDVITVRASPFCPEGRLLVIDDSAIEASWRQSVQQAGRSLYR